MESLAETSVVEEQRDYGLVNHIFPAELLGPFWESYRRLSSLQFMTAWDIIVNLTYPEEMCADMTIYVLYISTH